MPSGAFAVHGLSEAFLADKPSFHELCESLLEFMGDSPLVAHNASFDFGFINHELGRCGRDLICMTRMIDTLALARQRHPGRQAQPRCALHPLRRRSQRPRQARRADRRAIARPSVCRADRRAADRPVVGRCDRGARGSGIIPGAQAGRSCGKRAASPFRIGRGTRAARSVCSNAGRSDMASAGRTSLTRRQRGPDPAAGNFWRMRWISGYLVIRWIPARRCANTSPSAWRQLPTNISPVRSRARPRSARVPTIIASPATSSPMSCRA